MHDSSRLLQRSLGSAIIAAALLLATSSAGPGAVPALAQSAAQAPPTSVSVGGDVPKPFTLTLADLKTMPRTTVKIDEDAKTTVYEGVLLSEVLTRAGAPLGRELSGPAVATYILATATDGYQAVFALAEVDPAVSVSEIIVADTIDGKPLFEYQGPMRLVAPHDKRAVRSVRMLQKIDVVRLRK